MKASHTFTVLAILLPFLSTGCVNEEQFYTNVLRSDVFVQLYDDEAYDFLWVFDNSGSMQPRRDFVKDNLQSFLSTLSSRKAIDFQMAAVTTDYFTHQGALVKGAGGIEVVKSTESANPVSDFASIINNVTDSPTSFWEQGLESAYQAVKKHGSEFSREGVPLVIIFLTDEEDYSCKDNCFGVEPENNEDWIAWPVERYHDYFIQFKQSQDSLTHVFPIVGLPTGDCTVASDGDRYREIQEYIEDEADGLGVSGSICAGDLADSYAKIAEIIANRGVRFPLGAESSGSGIKVFVDQQLIPASPENYIYDAEDNSVVFTGAIPKRGSVIEVTYAQKTN